MMQVEFTKTRKLTFSALIAASYFVVMFATQWFAFGPYQIRVATAIYAMAYPFPFLVLPLALANSFSNMLGGFGMLDIVGGFGVGLVTAGLVAAVKLLRLPMFLVIFPIIFGPGLIVPLWLSPLTGLPYWALVVNICIGQTAPAILGYILIRALEKRKAAA